MPNAFKWQSSAFILFKLSFLLLSENEIRNYLAWKTEMLVNTVYCAGDGSVLVRIPFEYLDLNKAHQKNMNCRVMRTSIVLPTDFLLTTQRICPLPLSPPLDGIFRQPFTMYSQCIDVAKLIHFYIFFYFHKNFWNRIAHGRVGRMRRSFSVYFNTFSGTKLIYAVRGRNWWIRSCQD